MNVAMLKGQKFKHISDFLLVKELQRLQSSYYDKGDGQNIGGADEHDAENPTRKTTMPPPKDHSPPCQ